MWLVGYALAQLFDFLFPQLEKQKYPQYSQLLKHWLPLRILDPWGLWSHSFCAGPAVAPNLWFRSMGLKLPADLNHLGSFSGFNYHPGHSPCQLNRDPGSSHFSKLPKVFWICSQVWKQEVFGNTWFSGRDCRTVERSFFVFCFLSTEQTEKPRSGWDAPAFLPFHVSPLSHLWLSPATLEIWGQEEPWQGQDEEGC